MARYCFHTVRDGTYLDGTAVDLPGLKAAKKQATHFAGDLLRLEDFDVFESEIGVLVTDAVGLHLFTITTIGMTAPAAGVR